MNISKRGKLDLSFLRTRKEKRYFKLNAFIAIFMWLWIFSPIGIPFLTETTEFTWSGLAYTAAFLFGFQLLFTFFGLWGMAYIRMNGIKVGPKQFPTLYKSNQTISRKLGLSRSPDIFIINNGGLLNAFATKLAFRKVIVLYSDLVDALTTEKNDKQLNAVLTHEIGHHALGHCDFWVNYFISAASIFYPISNALSRARELSADRVMKEIIIDKEACSRALVKLSGGGKIGQTMNLQAYIEQSDEEFGFFAWIAYIHSSHPFLPDRVREIRSEVKQVNNNSSVFFPKIWSTKLVATRYIEA